jgi:hypothetical protein
MMSAGLAATSTTTPQVSFTPFLGSVSSQVIETNAMMTHIMMIYTATPRHLHIVWFIYEAVKYNDLLWSVGKMSACFRIQLSVDFRSAILSIRWLPRHL